MSLWAKSFSSYRFGHCVLKKPEAFSITFMDTNSGEISRTIFLWLPNVGTFNNRADMIFLMSSLFICL